LSGDSTGEEREDLRVDRKGKRWRAPRPPRQRGKEAIRLAFWRKGKKGGGVHVLLQGNERKGKRAFAGVEKVLCRRGKNSSIKKGGQNAPVNRRKERGKTSGELPGA